MRPIIIVTGANSGVGFGFCQRLLCQLSCSQPSDASLHGQTTSTSTDSIELPCDGLTLIMACRNEKRANAARARLLEKFNRHVERMKKTDGYDGLAEIFQKRLVVDIVSVDLTIMSSVLAFNKEITANYPYISHLVCNAGATTWTGMDWSILLRQLFSRPMEAITAPLFYVQTAGDMSLDGLGWVWQSNVFSHFVMFRGLELLLSSPAYPRDSRVIWVSSIEARPEFFDVDDWQLKKTHHPYENSKYHMDLIAGSLDLHALNSHSATGKRVRHFSAKPGVCSTNISASLVGPVLDALKVLLFYVGRLCGSPNHTISTYTAGVSMVYLCIVSLASITFGPRVKTNGTANGVANGTANGTPNGSVNGATRAVNGTTSTTPNGTSNGHAHLPAPTPITFVSQTNTWGTPKLGFQEVIGWQEHQSDAKRLVQLCDELYRKIIGEKYTDEWLDRSETASEKM